MERCAECGYAYDSLPRDELPASIRALGPRYAGLLTHDPSELRAHTSTGTWSPLEYACHLRDVLRVQRERIALALAEETPVFASMRREERVAEERYNDQEPEVVAAELSAAAEELAAALEALDGSDWLRTGTYNWPETRERTVEWIARHTVHEGEHHIMDIDRQLGPLK